MAIQLEQFEAKPILYYRFAGHVTQYDLEAVEQAEERHFAALGEYDNFYVVVDMQSVDTIAAPLFPKLQQMRMARDERVGLLVVIGANPYLRALAISLGIMNNNPNIIFRSNIGEAMLAIESRSAV